MSSLRKPTSRGHSERSSLWRDSNEAQTHPSLFRSARGSARRRRDLSSIPFLVAPSEHEGASLKTMKRRQRKKQNTDSSWVEETRAWRNESVDSPVNHMVEMLSARPMRLVDVIKEPVSGKVVYRNLTRSTVNAMAHYPLKAVSPRPVRNAAVALHRIQSNELTKLHAKEEEQRQNEFEHRLLPLVSPPRLPLPSSVFVRPETSQSKMYLSFSSDLEVGCSGSSPMSSSLMACLTPRTSLHKNLDRCDFDDVQASSSGKFCSSNTSTRSVSGDALANARIRTPEGDISGAELLDRESPHSMLDENISPRSRAYSKPSPGFEDSSHHVTSLESKSEDVLIGEYPSLSIISSEDSHVVSVRRDSPKMELLLLDSDGRCPPSHRTVPSPRLRSPSPGITDPLVDEVLDPQSPIGIHVHRVLHHGVFIPHVPSLPLSRRSAHREETFRDHTDVAFDDARSRSLFPSTYRGSLLNSQRSFDSMRSSPLSPTNSALIERLQSLESKFPNSDMNASRTYGLQEYSRKPSPPKTPRVLYRGRSSFSRSQGTKTSTPSVEHCAVCGNISTPA